KVDLETLLLEHAGDQLGIFLGLGIEANRCVVGKLRQALPLGEAGLREQLLRLVRIELGIVGHVGITELHRRDMRLRVSSGYAAKRTRGSSNGFFEQRKNRYLFSTDTALWMLKRASFAMVSTCSCSSRSMMSASPFRSESVRVVVSPTK